VKSISANIIKNKKLAIIIQGPLNLKDDFTLETVRLYKKIFQGAHIILSTWSDEPSHMLKMIESEGVELVLSERPEDFGIYNINLQIVSAASGIRRAKELGYRYSIKTRTDQRIYRYDLFDYFESLMTQFPLKEGLKQNKRLITWSFGTCKYRLYGLSDFFMFGDTNDMLNYWDADFYKKGIEKYANLDNTNMPPLIGEVPIVAEIYLFVKYLEKIELRVDWSLKQYWEVLRDYFCVVDGTSMDVFWDKYFKMSEHRYIRNYENTNHRAMEFSDWLQLFVEQKPEKWSGIRIPESWEYINGNLSVKNL
jgi:hypothetical protein